MQNRWAIAALFAICGLSGGVALAEGDKSTIDFVESLPAPTLMQGVGNSRLEISTDNEKAQRFFDQGVSLLHDFWWFEAYRSFRHATELDPDAAMPWWGVYMAADGMANLSEEERDEQLEIAVEKMTGLRDNASEREQYYLDAVLKSHGKEGDESEAAFRAELEALLSKYPDEIEARLFLWLKLDIGFSADGRPRGDQLYGQLMLEAEMDKHPDHQGLLHYWIHNQESGEHPETALGAAQRLASLAPNAGHIVHMPGHIHYRMGNYDAAHEQFSLADAADARYIRATGIDPVFVWNYLHNISFLIANLAEAGRFTEAMEYATAFEAMAEASAFKEYEGYSMLSGRAAMEPFKVLLRSGDFAAAADALRAAPRAIGNGADDFDGQRAAYQAYADGMAAIQAGDSAAAEQASRGLDSMLWRAERDEEPLRSKRLLTIYSLELQALVEHADGDSAQAVELLQRAMDLEDEMRYAEPPPVVRPVVESLADVHLADGEWEAARDAYRALLAKRNNSGYALFGVARSYELEGDTAQAAKAYLDFLKAWSSADADASRRRHAEAWLAANAD